MIPEINFRIGSLNISKIYLGTSEVWSRGEIKFKRLLSKDMLQLVTSDGKRLIAQ